MTSKSLLIIGHNSHRYEVVKGWGNLNVNTHPVADCHEMVIDKSGKIFLLTNETRNNILIYNNSGKLIGSWGHSRFQICLFEGRLWFLVIRRMKEKNPIIVSLSTIKI